jgi:hypothetical protein
MTRLLQRRLFFFAVFGLACSLPAFALQVKSLHPKGILELDNGEQTSLAGLLIPEESLSLLSVILSQKDLEFNAEDSDDYKKPGEPKAGYFYVNTIEMNFPFKPEDKPKETKVMVNELLLSLGLARVDAEKQFKHREKFLEIETEARTRGMGVWSYEEEKPKPAVSP